MAHLLGVLATLAGTLVVCIGLTAMLRGLLTLRKRRAVVGPDTRTALFRLIATSSIGLRGVLIGILLVLVGFYALFHSGFWFYQELRLESGIIDAIAYGPYSRALGWFDWMGVGVLVYAIILFALSISKRVWPRPHRCRKCKYDMSETPGVICPECGHDRTAVYRPRKRIAAALAIAFVWPIGLGIEWGFNQYNANGAYGLVPNWALVMGIDVLPEDMIYGTKGMTSWGEYTDGSLADRLAYSFDDDPLKRSVWRAIRDDIANPNTPDAQLAKLIALAGNTADEAGHFSDQDSTETILASHVIGRMFIEYAKGNNPSAESVIINTQYYETLANISDDSLEADDIPVLFTQIGRSDFVGWSAQSILAVTSSHRSQVIAWVEDELWNTPSVRTNPRDQNLAKRLARADAAFRERVIDMALHGTKDQRIQAFLLFSWVMYTEEDLTEIEVHRFARAVLAALDESDPELFAAGVMAMDVCPTILAETKNNALRELFTMLRENRYQGPVKSSSPLDLSMWLYNNYLTFEAPTELRIFAAESLLLWTAHDQLKVPELIHSLLDDLSYADDDPALLAVCEIKDDARWGDVDLEPMTWLPAAIEAAKKEFADLQPAQPGP